MAYRDMFGYEAKDNDDCDNKEDCFEIQACERKTCRAFDVSVPVTITPFATPEEPEVECKGELEVSPGHKKCESEDNSFKFTITQRINIEIPIKFSAEVCFDETCAAEKGQCDNQMVVEQMTVGQ